jgi:hypothetical protein
MIVASIALFFSLAGSAIAATHYLITSTEQIKPSVLKELRGKTGPRGPQGEPGVQGTAGANGSPGAAGTSFTTSDVTIVDGTSVGIVSPGNYVLTATCPSGDVVLGGGFNNQSAYQGSVPGADIFVDSSGPSGASTWAVDLENTSGTGTPPMYADAICGS